MLRDKVENLDSHIDLMLNTESSLGVNRKTILECNVSLLGYCIIYINIFHITNGEVSSDITQ